MNKTYLFLSLITAMPLHLKCVEKQDQQNAFVAIRSLVNFLEFEYAVNHYPWLQSTENISPESIQATFTHIKSVLPLAHKSEELLARFGNQPFLEELRNYNATHALSSDSLQRIALLASSVSIMIESLYKQSKITIEQRDVMQRVCNGSDGIISRIS